MAYANNGDSYEGAVLSGSILFAIPLNNPSSAEPGYVQPGYVLSLQTV